MDGTICQSPYVVRPENPAEKYMALEPYDLDTIPVWNRLSESAELYVVTLRSYKEAAGLLDVWMTRRGMETPMGIITAPPLDYAGESVTWKLKAWSVLAPDLIFDDDTRLFEAYYGNGYNVAKNNLYLMHNELWPQNPECETWGLRCRSWREVERIVTEKEKSIESK